MQDIERPGCVAEHEITDARDVADCQIRRGASMHFDERQIGRYRIYAAATPSSLGGFTASVSVKQRVAELEGDAFFTDPMLGDGFRFGDAKAALRYAFDVGHRQIRRRHVATLPN